MTGTESGHSLKVLSLLSKERAVYGLRNGDYERYRRHCANKIHRLRQVTGATCGKGKKYQAPPKMDAETIKDVRQLELQIFLIERALAHSHQLKHEKAKNPSLRKDQVSWLRKAAKLSNQLYEVVQTLSSASKENQSKVDVKTVGEVTIYHLTVRSELAFEKGSWIDALTDLACRRKLLQTLAEGAKDSYDQALATEFIDSHDPLIRFCAYKLGRADSHDIDGVMADIEVPVLEEAVSGLGELVEKLRAETGADEMEAGRKQLADVEFAGEKIEMRNAEIVSIMVRVQEVLGKLDNGKVSAGRGIKGWDRVLSVLGEAESVARRLSDDHEASGATSSLKSAKTAQSLALAHQYIIYLLLTNRIRRDLSLLSSLSASSLPSDPAQFKVPGGKARLEESVKMLGSAVKLHDTVLQSFRQAAELSIVQEKEAVRNGVEGLEGYFHAIRCYNLARLHCIHPTPSYGSAIQLLSTAAISLHRSRDLLETTVDEPIAEISSSSLEELEQNISSLEKAAKKALFNQVAEKPIFFDMAFNNIDIPIEELQRLAGSKERSEAVPTKAEDGLKAQSQAMEQLKKSRERETREATPGPEEKEEKKGGSGDEGKKGWLGGWFGRK